MGILALISANLDQCLIGDRFYAVSGDALGKLLQLGIFSPKPVEIDDVPIVTL